MIISVEKMKQAKNWWFFKFTRDFKSIKNPNVTFLISFPKCGVTWLRAMLCHVLIENYHLPENKHTVLLNELTSNYSILPKIVWTHEDSLIVTESGKYNDPKKLFEYGGRLCYRRNKIIMLVRDPRDVVVSHYYQVSKRTYNPLEVGSLSNFVRHPLYGFNRIIRFYQIWNWNRWLMKDFLIVRYEDLMNDGPATLLQILKFLGLSEIDQKILNEVYRLNQAENLRSLEKSNKVEGMRVFGSDDNSLKVRKAKIGSYKEELLEEDIDYCNDLMKNCPKIYGYY